MGKSRKTTSRQEVDPALVRESEGLLNLFRLLASGGYQPNRGVTVAGFTPKQEAAFDMQDQAARAFGFAPAAPSPMPPTETSALGIRGYRPSREFDAMEAGLSPGYQKLLSDFYNMLRG